MPQRLSRWRVTDHATYDPEGNVILTDLPPQDAQEPIVTLILPYVPSAGEIADRTQARAATSAQWIVKRREAAAVVASDLQSTLSSIRQNLWALPRSVWKLSTQDKGVSMVKTLRLRLRKTHTLTEVGRFVATFVGIFLVLFVGLNAQSYGQILLARILPERDAAVASALQKLTDGDLRRKLSVVPELPTAGRRTAVLPPLQLPVVPPDPRLVIPKIGKNVPLVFTSEDLLAREDWKGLDAAIQADLERGVVHYPGTAMPGQEGNAFFTGHSSYYLWNRGRYNEVFARLSELQKGDTYVVYHRGRPHHYRVRTVFEVLPQDVSVLDQPSGSYWSTLMTCSPVGTTLRRLIVQGEEVDPKTGLARGTVHGAPVRDHPSVGLLPI